MTKKDTEPDAPTDANPEADKVEDKLEELDDEAEKVHDKLEEPGTTPEEREQLGKRLDDIEAQQRTLLEKLDTLLASPVAPSPRRTATETDPPARETVPPQAGDQTPDSPPDGDEPPKKAPVSKAWFGNRAFD